MPTHIVLQGESLASIAHAERLASWRKIYDHPNNAELRRLRPDPHVLFPGDRVFVPERSEHKEQVRTGERHDFRVKTPKLLLRLALEDEHGRPIANANYTLTLDGAAAPPGRTDAAGRLEVPIPADTRAGSLTIGDHVWDLDVAHLNPCSADTLDEGVSGAQARLHNLGYNVGRIDGVMGPKTRAGVAHFQAAAGLPVTGALDAATRGRLVAVHGC